GKTSTFLYSIGRQRPVEVSKVEVSKVMSSNPFSLFSLKTLNALSRQLHLQMSRQMGFLHREPAQANQ
ncbi:MAG: hypothetical protein WB629_01735, partial [Candidatus Sulfotelmatobacter sp.]